MTDLEVVWLAVCVLQERDYVIPPCDPQYILEAAADILQREGRDEPLPDVYPCHPARIWRQKKAEPVGPVPAGG